MTYRIKVDCIAESRDDLVIRLADLSGYCRFLVRDSLSGDEIASHITNGTLSVEKVKIQTGLKETSK